MTTTSDPTYENSRPGEEPGPAEAPSAPVREAAEGAQTATRPPVLWLIGAIVLLLVAFYLAR